MPPSFGDSGSSYILLNTPPHFVLPLHPSSYILNTPPHLAIPVHHISYPSFGDSGSSYIMLNTPPHVVLPLHQISLTFSLMWRLRFIIYLQHAPSFSAFHQISLTCPRMWRFWFIMYLTDAPSFSASASSYFLNAPAHSVLPVHYYILNMPTHLAIPGNHKLSYILNPPSFGDNQLNFRKRQKTLTTNTKSTETNLQFRFITGSSYI